MKGTMISRISTQNNEVLEESFKEISDKVQDYLLDTPNVADNDATISAYSLLEILRDYYSPLSDIMDPESEETKKIVSRINEHLNGPKKVIGFRKSKNGASIINDLLGKIGTKTTPVSGKEYTNMRYFIRDNSVGAILDYTNNGKYEKLVVCRDSNAHDLYYGQMSYVDNDIIDYIYDELIRDFDTIDAYRLSLPEQIDTDISYDDFACKPYEYAKYSVPFTSSMVNGEIFVNSNGYVDVDMHLTRENNPYAYTRIGEYQRNIKNLIEEIGADMLAKIPVDVDSIEEPLRGIVIASLAKLDEVALG